MKIKSIEEKTGILLSEVDSLKLDAHYLEQLSDSLIDNKNQMGFFFDGIVIGFFLNLLASVVYDFFSFNTMQSKILQLVAVFIVTLAYLKYIYQKHVKIYKHDLEHVTTLLKDVESRSIVAENKLKSLKTKLSKRNDKV